MTRGGKRAGAGAPFKDVKRDVPVLLRFTAQELIVIDVLAEKQNMKRCEFIRHCIDQQILSAHVQ